MGKCIWRSGGGDGHGGGRLQSASVTWTSAAGRPACLVKLRQTHKKVVVMAAFFATGNVVSNTFFPTRGQWPYRSAVLRAINMIA